MLRNISKASKFKPVIVSMRCMGGGGPQPGKYESDIVTKELGFKRKRLIRDMIQAEKEYIATLPGISSDEYKPSLEPGTINLRSVHPTYYSPQLRGQTQEQTDAAWDKINAWQARISEAKGTDRVPLVRELIDDFKCVLMFKGDPVTDIRDSLSYNATNIMKYHGVVRGVEGYMILNVADDPELEEACIELSENIWLPQLWAGGKFIADWRELANLHLDGPLVQILEGCGLSSKLKGCYYEENSPLVLH